MGYKLGQVSISHCFIIAALCQTQQEHTILLLECPSWLYSDAIQLYVHRAGLQLNCLLNSVGPLTSYQADKRELILL